MDFENQAFFQKKKITFTILIFIFSWFIIEGFLQVLTITDLIDGANITDIFKSSPYIANDYLITVPKPNSDASYTDRWGKRVIIHHNNLGMRGKNVNFTKDKDVIRIISMGGSSTYCWNFSDGNTWSDIVGKKLSKEYHGKHEMLNAGVSGYSSFPNLIYFAGKISSLKPDYIIIYHTANDILRLQQRDFDGDYSGYTMVQRVGNKQSIYYFLYKNFNTVRAISYIKNLVKNSIRRSQNDLQYNNIIALEKTKKRSSYFIRNIENIFLMAQKQGIKVILSSQASPYPFMKENPEIWEKIIRGGTRPFQFISKDNIPEIFEYYTDELRKFAATHDVIFVDNAKLIQQQIKDNNIDVMAHDPYDKKGFFTDWIHFGIIGSQFIGKNIAEELLKDLRKGSGQITKSTSSKAIRTGPFDTKAGS